MLRHFYEKQVECIFLQKSSISHSLYESNRLPSLHSSPCIFNSNFYHFTFRNATEKTINNVYVFTIKCRVHKVPINLKTIPLTVLKQMRGRLVFNVFLLIVTNAVSRVSTNKHEFYELKDCNKKQIYWNYSTCTKVEFQNSHITSAFYALLYGRLQYY